VLAKDDDGSDGPADGPAAGPHAPGPAAGPHAGGPDAGRSQASTHRARPWPRAGVTLPAGTHTLAPYSYLVLEEMTKETSR
jgi:hypothetical protein